MNTVKKMTRLVFIICVLFIGIVGVASVDATYAATINEVEPNETKETATVINVGDWYSGEIGSYDLRYKIRDNEDDDDYIEVINCVEGKTYTVVMTNYTYYSEITPHKTLLVSLQYPNGQTTTLTGKFIIGYGGHYYSFVAPTSGSYYLHLYNYTDNLTKTEHYYTIGMFGVCDLNGHAYNWEVKKEATCTEKGLKEGKCSECGDVVLKDIPACHAWSSQYTVDKAATCTEAGSGSIHCIICNEIKEGSSIVIDAKGHSFDSWQTMVAATELSGGQQMHTCSRCGYSEQLSTAQLLPSLPSIKISKPKAAKKSAVIKWKKVTKKNMKKIQGIEIQVALDPGFSQIVKSATAGKKKTSKVVKGLAPKTTYWVRIRAFKNAADGKHVSAWKVKKVKIKK